MSIGEIVLVRFPFSDFQSSKKRPALIIVRSNLSATVGLTMIAMITSRVDGMKLPGDCVIDEWQNAGLLNPSMIRLAKIATVATDLVEKAIGMLNKSDLLKVKRVFRKHFHPWL